MQYYHLNGLKDSLIASCGICVCDYKTRLALIVLASLLGLPPLKLKLLLLLQLRLLPPPLPTSGEEKIPILRMVQCQHLKVI